MTCSLANKTSTRYLVILVFIPELFYLKRHLCYGTHRSYKWLTIGTNTLKKPNSKSCVYHMKKSLSVELLFRLFHKGYLYRRKNAWNEIGPQVSNSFWMSSMFLIKKYFQCVYTDKKDMNIQRTKSSWFAWIQNTYSQSIIARMFQRAFHSAINILSFQLYLPVVMNIFT